MQRGKEDERLSMLRAEMSAPAREVDELEYDASGVVKFWERWFSIGVNLSSSSNRGNALDVAYIEIRIFRLPESWK